MIEEAAGVSGRRVALEVARSEFEAEWQMGDVAERHARRLFPGFDALPAAAQYTALRGSATVCDEAKRQFFPKLTRIKRGKRLITVRGQRYFAVMRDGEIVQVFDRYLTRGDVEWLLSQQDKLAQQAADKVQALREYVRIFNHAPEARYLGEACDALQLDLADLWIEWRHKSG